MVRRFGIRPGSAIARVAVAGVVLVAAAGCATTSGAPRWGSNATLLPEWTRLRGALVDATTSSGTWGPAAGALLLQVGRADEELADWAADRTPLFGSRDRADDASDLFLHATEYALVITGLAANSGPGAREWVLSKAVAFGLEALAVEATTVTTDLLKDRTDRRRPDGTDTRSFPSGHSSRASVRARLAVLNARYLPGPPALRTTAQVTCVALQVGTAWARVEARRHYPVDVLAGAALGNFIGTFVFAAFIDDASPGAADLSLGLVAEGVGVLYRRTW